ncbi:MAG: M10 family metallopeptidase C-terminal domain-containing protein, partial [Alphaproteobacteria bacterium]|nr:M10 family metallopeptidase C-terminal domain-containing protein [Alphaproteobacteria bacterium]
TPSACRACAFTGANARTCSGCIARGSLTGGAGDDVLTGGAGKDRFVWSDLSDGHDIVTDFHRGQDKLDLSAFDGTFVFLGAAAFSGGSEAHEVRYDVLGSGHVKVEIAIGGSHLDAEVLLISGSVLTASDFIL